VQFRLGKFPVHLLKASFKSLLDLWQKSPQLSRFLNIAVFPSLALSDRHSKVFLFWVEFGEDLSGPVDNRV